MGDVCVSSGNSGGGGEQINLELESIERIKPFGIKRRSLPPPLPCNLYTCWRFDTVRGNYIAIGVDFPAHRFQPLDCGRVHPRKIRNGLDGPDWWLVDVACHL